MMTKGNYTDRPAIVITSQSVVATFLPQDGGKLASLQVKSSGKELLAVRKEEEYKVLTYNGDYVSSECSGFDDMFPTVDPYTPLDGEYVGITYPDHGETCRIPYTYEEYENGVVFRSKSKIFPIEYEKTVLPSEDGGLNIGYCIRNHGDVEFSFLWAGHIMLQGEDGMRVFAPFDEDAAIEMMFATEGTVESDLPRHCLTGYRPGAGPAYKFYYLEPMKEGRFGVSYKNGSRLFFEVEPQKLPYLGLWFNNGEFQDLYSITLEPCSVPFDAPDRAEKHGYVSKIPPHSEFSFQIHILWED